MPEAAKFSIAARLRSFTHAFRGLGALVATQHNAWIHALATLVACSLGAALRIAPLEWCAVVIAIAAVWSAEALNTAVEALCDVVAPERNEAVGRAKDLAAAGVLVAAIGATLVGLIVFLPALGRLGAGG